jgi:pilus assembly protein CpaC
MTGSSRYGRRKLRQRRKRLLAAALCAASFVTSQVLCGGDNPSATSAAPSIFSEYDLAKNRLAAGPSQAADNKASASSKSTESPPALESLPSAKKTGRSLRPAALEAVSETHVAESDVPSRDRQAPRPAVVTTSAERSEKTIRTAHASRPQEPVATEPASPSASSPPEEIDDSKLPPIVPAWAVPRPARKSLATQVAPSPTIPSAATAVTPSVSPSAAAAATSTGTNPLRAEAAPAQPSTVSARPVALPPVQAATSKFSEQRPATDRFASWPKALEPKKQPSGQLTATPAANTVSAAPAWLSKTFGQQPLAASDADSSAIGSSPESQAEPATPSSTASAPPAVAAPPAQPLEIRNPNFGRSAASTIRPQAVTAVPEPPVVAVEPAAPEAEPVRLESPAVAVEQSPAHAKLETVARVISPEQAAEKPVAANNRVVNASAAESRASEHAIRKTDFEVRALAEQPAILAPPGVREEDLGVLPAESPFEAIAQSGTVKLRVRRSVLLRTKVDVYRTAIVDEAVCDIVQFTPRELSIIGRSVGQTHVTFWLDDPGSAPITYLVEVLPDPQQIKADENKYELLQNVINEMFPDSKIFLVLVADKLLVKGQAKDSEEAAQIMNIVRAQASGVTAIGGVPGLGIAQGLATPVLSPQATGGAASPQYQVINMLRVPGVQQVALRVKIAELNRTAARGFGVDARAAIDFTDSAKTTQLFLASLLNTSSTSTGGTAGSTAGGTSVVTSFGGQDVNIGLRYLQERGVIRLLSEPTLVTLSGRPATFIAGGEFAVPTIVGSVGLNAVTTDFRAFGAIISFLPTIVDKDRIRLQVAPEFSQINSSLTSSNNTPGLNVRAATTTVEMREGQTLAIAGLLEDSYKATNVGDLPFLAKIFGRRDTSRNETELIILVTPELVHPMEPEEVPPLPGFDVTEPTAWQFFGHGEIEGNPTQDYRSTVWPRLKRRYGMGGPAMTSGPFGHGQ